MANLNESLKWGSCRKCTHYGPLVQFHPFCDVRTKMHVLTCPKCSGKDCYSFLPTDEKPHMAEELQTWETTV